MRSRKGAGTGASVQIHALTGEVIEDLKEYKTQPSDPDRQLQVELTAVLVI